MRPLRTRSTTRSVAEMTLPREHHRNAVLVGRSDHFGVAQAATGLDHGADPGVGGDVEAVAEREEGVTGAHPTASPPGSAFRCDARRIDAVLLTRADSHCLTVLGENDRVAADCCTHLPGEAEVGPLIIGGSGARD